VLVQAVRALKKGSAKALRRVMWAVPLSKKRTSIDAALASAKAKGIGAAQASAGVSDWAFSPKAFLALSKQACRFGRKHEAKIQRKLIAQMSRMLPRLKKVPVKKWLWLENGSGIVAMAYDGPRLKLVFWEDAATLLRK